MAASVETYTPVSLTPVFRRQAWKVWTIGSLIVAVWVLAILAAPVAKASGFIAISTPFYNFFSYMCHQLSERSFHIKGEPFGVCARCFGVYFGLLFGFLIYPMWRSIDNIEPLPRYWLFLSLIPISIDWSLTIFGIWENTHTSRFITGLILGAACSTFIVPAAVEITRNFTALARTKRQAPYIQ